MVAFTCFVGIYFRKTLDKVMSVVGALTCTPIAFILPALFHYKLCAKTKFEKASDMAIIVFCTFLMIFTSGYTFATWNVE